jgi:hypothetical protein
MILDTQLKALSLTDKELEALEALLAQQLGEAIESGTEVDDLEGSTLLALYTKVEAITSDPDWDEVPAA